MSRIFQNINHCIFCCRKELFPFSIKCNKIMKHSFSTIRFIRSLCFNINKFPVPELDESYLCNPDNEYENIANIKRRKGFGNIKRVVELHNKLQNMQSNEDKVEVQRLLTEEMLKIPNRTHPEVIKQDEAKVVKLLGNRNIYSFKPDVFENIANRLHLLHTGNEVSNFMGHRSYFFISKLAELEWALVKYSLGKLIDKGFKVISVPDVLDRRTIERCGFETTGKRNQVYKLSAKYHDDDKCLSGTAEMGIAGFLMNKEFSPDKLPLRLASVSRCFRAETSRVSEERGIYRVHQFYKVEMFGVSEPEKSNELLEEFRLFEEEHFASFGIHLRVLDMPPSELGAQAFRKYDIEAWLPGKNMWAEVSSCSDCTDYQSRRLAIRSGGRFVHTVNGTACAVPRMVIALLETHQQSDGSVLIPQNLQPLMNTTHINKSNTKESPKIMPNFRTKK